MTPLRPPCDTPQPPAKNLRGSWLPTPRIDAPASMYSSRGSELSIELYHPVYHSVSLTLSACQNICLCPYRYLSTCQRLWQWPYFAGIHQRNRTIGINRICTKQMHKLIFSGFFVIVVQFSKDKMIKEINSIVICQRNRTDYRFQSQYQISSYRLTSLSLIHDSQTMRNLKF